MLFLYDFLLFSCDFIWFFIASASVGLLSMTWAPKHSRHQRASLSIQDGSSSGCCYRPLEARSFQTLLYPVNKESQRTPQRAVATGATNMQTTPPWARRSHHNGMWRTATAKKASTSKMTKATSRATRSNSDKNINIELDNHLHHGMISTKRNEEGAVDHIAIIVSHEGKH